jgi:hypothetical protein
MARPKLNILSGAVPGGPMKVGIPKGGPRVDPLAGTGALTPKRDHRSKKAYTGTLSGLGRTPSGHVLRSGPKGPGGASFPSTALPPRARGAGPASSVRFQAAPPPSLMTRIGRKLRGITGKFGF